MFNKNPKTREIKQRARRTLSRHFSQEQKNYVADTSAVINKALLGLIKKGLKGRLIIPNAVMAELENLANKGRQEGFLGLEEVTKLHHIKTIRVYFQGLRPNEHQIKFAKSGEIDALIREIARKNKAVLITADLVQAKSSQAYGLEVLYIRPKFHKQKKSFFKFWKS